MTSAIHHMAAVAELASRLRVLRADVVKMQASADSPDGLVRATIGWQGELLELELDDRIFRTSDSVALASAIAATIQAAAKSVEDLAVERSAELFPE
jgi:DNA-binding protein YbaB